MGVFKYSFNVIKKLLVVCVLIIIAVTSILFLNYKDTFFRANEIDYLREFVYKSTLVDYRNDLNLGEGFNNCGYMLGKDNFLWKSKDTVKFIIGNVTLKFTTDELRTKEVRDILGTICVTYKINENDNTIRVFLVDKELGELVKW